MADIAAGDVTYTVVKQRIGDGSLRKNLVRLSFGDGALTYPASGIPLTKGKMGCPVDIQSLVVVDKGTSGYSFMYDQSAEKLVMFQEAARTHTHDIKAIGGLTLTAAYGTDANAFGKNTATNATIVGANSATNGGVVSATLAAQASAEPSAVAIAAQVIEVEVVGY